MLIGLSLGQVGSWLGHPVAVPAALLGGLLGVLTAILLSRAVTSALARVMTSRGGRILGAVIVSLTTLVPLGLNLLLTTGSVTADIGSFDATRSATVASWTPVGWAWALPFDVATGRWGSAALHLGLAVTFIAVLWAVWVGQLERAVTSPLTSFRGPADRSRSPAPGPARHLSHGDDRGAAGPRVVPRQPARRHRPAHRRAPGLLRRPGGAHRHAGAGWRRRGDPGGLRRAHPDERPRVRRTRVVGCTSPSGARGRTGWAARSPPPSSSGRWSSSRMP